MKDENTPFTAAVTGKGVDLTVGRFYIDSDSLYLNGYLDELRVSKGIARWTSNFTPPSEAYYVELNVVGGTVNDSARIITIDEDTWSIIGNEVVSTGAYESWTTSGTKMIIARRETDGELLVYGGVTPIV